MADHIPQPKRRWPDGVERVCDGSVVIVHSPTHHGQNAVVVNELPKEVRKLMLDSKEELLELHHHADPEVQVYVNSEDIVAIDARWSKIEED